MNDLISFLRQRNIHSSDCADNQDVRERPSTLCDLCTLLKKSANYELLHYCESCGEDFFGMKIFVKLSARKIADDTFERSGSYDTKTNVAIRALEKAIRTRTVQLDPKGAETRQLYRREIENIYKNAGVTAIYLEELPNGYCSDYCCLNRPWFKVTSAIGHVIIGWRKRVMSIDWQETTIRKSGTELFPDEDVTRSERGIHAWGVEAATRYIQKLHSAEAWADVMIETGRV